MNDAAAVRNTEIASIAMNRLPAQIGAVIAISGFKLSCLMSSTDAHGIDKVSNPTVGSLIKIPTRSSTAFGFIESLALGAGGGQASGRGDAIAHVDLLGETVAGERGGPPVFSRGISVYPVLGAPVFMATSEDIAMIYAKSSAWALNIGSLYQDPDQPAYLMSQEFLAKHSAIIGTTGSGKSCALTLILRSLLSAHHNGHVVLLDPHGEYAPAFAGMAECMTPETLQLPHWLFSFEEIIEIFCSKDRVDRSHEMAILKDAIFAAKQDFVRTTGKALRMTVDTPIPYRITNVLQRISDAMGKLDNPHNVVPYLRLMSTIEALRHDRRYAFMFEGLSMRDNMDEIIADILRIPVSGRPITILDLSAVPSEIVSVVVSVLCRLIFDFALWTDRREAIPILLVCDEAHRYIPQDERLGFEATRRSISRIAKEGRKHGVSLCLVTQRPSELSEAVLSQCSTIFALRMTNMHDQKYVRSMLPDSALGLLNSLPALRQREAIVVGEGVAHPMRIRFAHLDPEFRPRGEAMNFPAAWEKDTHTRAFVASIIDRWRSH
jgi:uncharacterized protein